MKTAVYPESSDRPLVFAHRGSSDRHAEHTLEAYRHALDSGADGLECDVRLTRDGHLVCVHDARLDRTSNGSGKVSLHTLAQLGELDFGASGGILTLEQLLTMALDAGRPLELLIETKHPNRYGAAVEVAVLRLLETFGLTRPGDDDLVRVTLMSFWPPAIRRIRRMAPQLPTVLLLERPVVAPRSGRLPWGTGIGGPRVEVLRTFPELAARLQRRGHRVYVWTVNQPDELDLAIRLGVDGIITDRPGFVIGELRSRGLRNENL